MEWLRRLGVQHLRTGLSWADSFRPHADTWFDHQMAALDDFAVTGTFCFTPESLGVRPHHTSPPREVEGFAEFCARMVRRYGEEQERKEHPPVNPDAPPPPTDVAGRTDEDTPPQAPDRLTSHKTGSHSLAQKEINAGHVDEPAPHAGKVAGAFGREPDPDRRATDS